MPAPALPRSDLATRHPFPDHLNVGGRHLLLVDDPATDVLWKGDNLLGWAGDDRLALYLDPGLPAWILMRWCEDRAYRPVIGDRIEHNALVVIGKMVQHLIDHDVRRGFDVVASITGHNDRLEADRMRVVNDWISEEGAPRMAQVLRAATDHTTR